MAKGRQKNCGRGRPVTTGVGMAIVVRCHEDFLRRIDRWVAQQEDKPSRPEAIRRLAELRLGTWRDRGRSLKNRRRQTD
jgi:hypothetical protein